MPTATLPDDDELQRVHNDEFEALTSPEHLSRDGKNLRDQEFEALTNPEHYSRDAQHPIEDQPNIAQQEAQPGLIDRARDEPDDDNGFYKRTVIKKIPRRRYLVLWGTGGTAVIVSIYMAIMSWGSMLLPSFSNLIDSNRLARFTRNLTVHTDNIVKTKLALASTSDAKYAEMLRRYGGDFNNNTLWAKINRFRPDKVAERLALDMQFEIEERRLPGGVTRLRITAVSYTYDNPKYNPNNPGKEPRTITRRVPIPEHNFSPWERIRHPVAYINSVMGYRKATKGLVTALLSQGNPSWFTRVIQRLAVRSQAAAELRRVLDIKTYRWSRADVQRAQREGVQNPLEEEMARSHSEAFTTASGGDRLPVDADADAREAASQTTACTKNPECMRQIIENGDTIAPEARIALSDRFNPSKASAVVAGVIGTISSLADISNLACKMYEASIMASGNLINSNTAMAVASYTSFSAAAAQRIYSDTHPDDQRVHAALLGGYEQQINGKVGPVEPGGAGRSNIYKYAEGKELDTRESPSPQATPIGSFATNPFGFLPGPIGIDLLAALGNSVTLLGKKINFCDVATNIWGQVGLTIAELGFTLIPGVGPAIKGAGTAISKFAVWAVTKQLAKNVGRAFTVRNLAESGALYAADNVLSIIAISHAVQSMAGVFNGLAAGEAYLNQVDAGAESMGQDMVRAYGGRPLTESQYESAEEADQEFRVAALQTQSFTERYFARSNPQSLVNRLGLASYLALTNFNATERLSSVMQSVAKLFNPPQLLAALTGAFGGQSFALDEGGEIPDSRVLRHDYGITQFGWTNDEIEAATEDPEYSPLVNEEELEASGRRAEIEQKYGRCFSLNTQIGDLLAGNPESGQINGIIKGDFSGAMEKLPAIIRDSNGNVDPNMGICAPNNLGDSGPDNDGQLTFKSEEAKLVFRYRLSLANHCAVNELLAIQELTDVPGCGGNSARTTGSGGIITPEGYTFPMDPTLPFTQLPCTDPDGSCHHDNSGAFDLMFNGVEGQPVFAISDGEVLYSTHWEGSCYSIQFRSDVDGLNYWYGHITRPVAPGKVKAGDVIAYVDTHKDQGGDNECRNEGGEATSDTSHLHIDRARAPGLTAGIIENRDPCFVPFLNNLWAVSNGKPAIYTRSGC